MQLSKVLIVVSNLVVVLLFTGCTTNNIKPCGLPCQMNIVQTSSITVQEFVNNLAEIGWVESSEIYPLQASYARDTYSNVLETVTTVPMDIATLQFNEIDLYIGNIGSVTLDIEAIPFEEIEAIRVHPNISLFESILLYGFPEGGKILPYFVESDLNANNPCPNRSHYIAYYNDGEIIIRGEISHPIYDNIWTTQVEIFYPMGESLEFIKNSTIETERLDHIPCFPD